MNSQLFSFFLFSFSFLNLSSGIIMLLFNNLLSLLFSSLLGW